MPYISYTAEQKQLVNSIDLPEFLRMRGETLVPVGREYKLICYDATGEHDSITIRGSKWFDHKNQIGGGPVRLMREHYGMSFHAAMKVLLGYSSITVSNKTHTVNAKEKKEFKLPESNDNMRKVYAYLIKKRFISPHIIKHFSKKQLLFEDNKYHNAVFVGVDEKGIPRQAHKRSTNFYGKSFRMTCEGSDTSYSFGHFGISQKLFVFEAPVDLMSFLTLYPKRWKHHSYISMNGVYESAVIKALETHSNLTEIILCTDNDEGGIDAAYRLADILKRKGYSKIYRRFPKNKDWNEDLKERNGRAFLPAVPHRRIIEYNKQVKNLSYYSCESEKLKSRLSAAYNNGQYVYIAEYALAGSAFFMSKIKEINSEGSCFLKLKFHLIKNYRAYRDRSRNAICRSFNEAMRDVLKELENHARTKEQTVDTSKMLLRLADYAVRMSVDKILPLQNRKNELEH